MKLKRIMAIVLCFAMVLSTMSFNVLAEESNAVVSSLEELQNALKADDNLPIVMSETIVISEDVTLNLNGKTITTAETEKGTYVDAFTILADVTITGEGTIDARPSHGYTFYVGDKEGNGGNLTIENGTFYGETSVVNNRLGTVTINGGYFEVSLENEGDSYSYVLNCIDDSYQDGSASIVVKGGTFVNFNPAENAAEGENTNFVAEGYISTDNGDGMYGVTEETPAINAVAKIGDTPYATFDEAITAANSMTGDVTVEIYDKVTLNKNLSGSYDSIKFVGKDTDAEIYLDVQGYITASGKNVSFADLTLSKSEGGFITNAGFMNVAFGVYDVNEVTYTNCTFTNGAYASSGKVTFDECTFYRSHDKYGLWAYGNVDVVVDGCTFADYRGIKMYAEGAAKTVDLTVKNTDFSALDSKPAIVLTYGESVTLEGNTYSDTGVFELDLDGAPNGTSVTSDVAPTCKNDNGACGVLVNGKIYTTVADAAAVATDGSTVTLLHNSTETIEFAEGVTLDKNGFTAEGVTVAEPSLSGSGTEEDPYLINNLAELKWFRDKVNTYTSDGSNQYKGKYVKLNADIDLAGENWEPIGNNANDDHESFMGIFDGGGHTIKNLYVISDGDHLGFFARIGSYAEGINPTVKNITFENVDVSSNTLNGHGESYVGGVIANAGGNSIVENVKVKGNIYVTGYGYVGGIVGHGYPDLTDCSVIGNDGSWVHAHYWCAGGIIGYAGEGGTPITNCQVEGLDIWSAYGAAAAVAGLLQAGNKLTNVSAKDVEITSDSDYCMGVVAGNGEASTLINVTATNVTATAKGNEITYTDAVAKVNNTYYATLNDAIIAAAPNGTVEILSDIEVDEWVMFSQTKTIGGDTLITLNMNGLTINGNDHTLTVKAVESATNGDYLFDTADNIIINDLTVNLPAESNGLLGGSGGTLDNVNINGGKYSLTVSKTKNLTIKNCTFAKESGTAIYTPGDNDLPKDTPYTSTLTIDGCTFNVATAGDGYAVILRGENDVFTNNVTNNKVNVLGENVTLTGNTFNARLKFYPSNPTVKDNKILGTVEYADDTETIDLSQNYWGENMNEETILAKVGDKGSVLSYYAAVKEDGTLENLVSIKKAVAQIGDVKYETLADAITNANGATVTLIADTAETIAIAENANVVIDLGGKTLNGYIAPCKPTSLTISNGYIVNSDNSVSAIEINAGELTLTDVNIDSARHAVRIDGAVTATINGGTYKVIDVTGTRHAVNVSGDANVTIIDGTFIGPKGTTMDSGAAVNVQAGAKVTIKGGNFSNGKNHTLNSKGTLVVEGGIINGGINVPVDSNGTISVSGGTFDQDPSAYVAECYAALPDLNGNYVVGAKPTATVNDFGATVIPAGDYNIYGSGSNTVDMPLNFVMQFLADQTEADMETSPYADWYADFVITFEGLESGSFVADGCYLAGHYGSYGWVKVPVDGMTIEDGVRYPVMLGVGLGQKYDYVCSSVQDFKCALYLTPEVLAANPNLKVNLELAVVDNSKGEDAATEAIVNNKNIYKASETVYTAEDFKGYVAKIGEQGYTTFADALNAVQDGETITLLDVTGDESKTEIDFTKDIAFTITGDAPGYALPVVTFQNATVTIEDAEILIPELDARQNATINVVDSIVHDAGGNGIVKSYYNGAINISGTSVVHTMQVTTMGYITISDSAKLNATWQTNVYGNGMITVEDTATFATAALHLTGQDYSGRDNTDADRVGKPAAVVVDGAKFIVGKVYSDNGADYSYNSSKGINIGTVDGKSAVLDIKNGATVNIYMANGETANIGAGGTVNVNGSTFNVACRAENGTVTLANNGAINVSGTSDIAATKVTGAGWVYMNGVTLDADTKLDGAKVRFASGTNNIDSSVIDNGFFQVGIGAYNGVDDNVDTVNGVTVNVKNAKIGSNGDTYAGWIGTGYYDTDAEKAAAMNEAKYILNIDNSIADFGYLHVSNDGELNVTGNAAEKAHYNNSDYSFYAGDFIINGVATFDATDVLALYTKVSCDNGTDKPGTLNIVNGTEYEAERHNGAISGTNFVLYKTGVVNVNDAELYIGEYTSIAADAAMNIGGKATALGTITNNGTINLITANATLTTPEAPVVTSTVNGYEVVYADGQYIMTEVNYVAQIGDKKYTSLQKALDDAAAGTGNVTVDILADIDLTDVDWNPVTVSAPGYPVVTVNGNNKTITGLNDMLFAGTWAGGSGLIINDLTIADSNIVNDKDDAKGTVGVGAFIGYPQASEVITLNNCHLVNSTVEGGHWTGGLIGMAGGYNGNDGPVFMNLTITGCSVTDSTITGKGSAGGVIGHGSCAAWTNVVIEDTTVSGNTITSTGSSTNKAGAVMGTIGAAGQPTTADGETKTGGASVSATVSGNTVTSGDTTITTIYGRQGTETGMLYVTGGNYDNYPIEENVTYAQPKEGYEIVQNEDGTYGVEKAAEKFGFYGMNLDLESSIKMNFYILSDNFKGTDYYAKIVHSAATGDIERIVNFADWEDNGSYKQISYTDLAAKNMADTVTVTIFDGNDNQVSVDYVRSIKNYAEDYIKANAEKDDKWVTPFVDMLNYGTEAQKYFDYNEENLANANIGEYQDYATKQDVELSADVEKSPENVYGANLDLEDRIVYNGYFANVTDGMSATVSYRDHFNNLIENPASLVENGSYHQVSIDSLVIADANQLVTITVYDAEGNVHAFRSESINGYLYNAIQSKPDFEPLARAMAKFTASAYTALHN